MAAVVVVADQRCPRCDRPTVPVQEFIASMLEIEQGYPDLGVGKVMKQLWQRYDAEKRCTAPGAHTCHGVPVDWRTRCVAAEAEAFASRALLRELRDMADQTEPSLWSRSPLAARIRDHLRVPAMSKVGKVGICLDDPETRAAWDTAQQAVVEVASWPAWKRGDDVDLNKITAQQALDRGILVRP